MAKREADFSAKTTRIIAARAGFRCSFPGCDEATIGPGPAPTDIEKKGIAAHIFAASAGGPRGPGGLSVAERSSPMNGIWLCADHGRQFDGEKGKNYPASTLQSWKALQEQRIANELNKVKGPALGWLVSMEIGRNPLFRPQALISFGKVTLLIGANGTGKTALCEWLTAAAGFPALLERWARPSGKAIGMRAIFVVVVPDRHEFLLEFDGADLVCAYDGVPATDLSQVLCVRYIRERAPRSEGMDDVDYLASIWSVHPYQVREILKEMTGHRFGFVRRAEVRPDTHEDEEAEEDQDSEAGSRQDSHPPQEVFAQIGEHEHLLGLQGLSAREQSQVIVSGAMALVHRESLQGPAMLIIELGGQLLPDPLLSEYARRLNGPDLRFQTILVSPIERPKVDWSGWSVARLEGRPPQVRVRQEVIAA